MSQQNQVRRIVNVALFGALSFVCARFCQIPFGIGYLNIGDLIIILAAMLVGPIDGALAGMIGGGFADLAAGFGSFIPFTIVAKALLGITVGYSFKGLRQNLLPTVPVIPAYSTKSPTFKGLENKKYAPIAIFAGAYVQAHIYFFAYYLHNYDAFEGNYIISAFSSAFMDFLQGIVCGMAALPLYRVLSRMNYFSARLS